MADINSVVTEIKEYVAKIKGKGATQEEIREGVLGSYDHTTLVAFQLIGNEIAESPEAGAFFAYSVNETLGGVNAVLIEEGLTPIHISELDFVGKVIVKTLEAYTGEHIDQVLWRVEQQVKGGLN